MKATELVALLDGRRIGVVEQDRAGGLNFTYDDDWRDSPDAYPLSLSLPLVRRLHRDERIRPFLEGLLPDNPAVLRRWGRDFHVSPRNPFALLTHMGEDCAGAVQLVAPDRVDAILDESGSVDWLSETEIGDRLRDLVANQGTGRFAADQGRFSLAGAQPKTALYHDGHRWGVPSGSIPTTHILKPPAQPELADFEINEHFCLTLADAVDIPVARTAVASFDGQRTILVERFDRRQVEGRVERVHQEDLCQALGVPPWRKYENEGGPGAPLIVELLLRESTDPEVDVGRFMDALTLNWIILGTDAHAKNYSVMLRAGAVHLAPSYDLLSALPYERSIPLRRAKSAMRFGGEYHLWKVRARHWRRLASECGLDVEPVLSRTEEVAAAVLEATPPTAEALLDSGLTSAPVRDLQARVTARAERCLSQLA